MYCIRMNKYTTDRLTDHLQIAFFFYYACIFYIILIYIGVNDTG